MIRRLAPLVLLVVAVAGCIGGAPAETGAPTDDDPTVVEDPDNYTYVDNASFSSGGHVHDYWDGHDRLTVVDESRETVSTWFGPARPLETFRPEEGTTIPQGTERVEVTVDWTEEPDTWYDRMELWIKTAADDNASFVAEIAPGDTVTFASKNAENDLPHRQLSAWEFQYYVHPIDVQPGGVDVTQTYRFRGEVSMQVEAVRGLDLPVFPAHPDLWQNRSEIELMEAERSVRYRGDPAGGWSAFGGSPTIHSPDNGTIVPFDSDVVEFRLSYEPRLPGTDMELKVHAADTWAYTELEPDEVADDGTKVYRVPVDESMGDGPYSDQSLWQFAPYPSEPRPYEWVDGTYTLSATAIRDAGSG